MFAVYAGYVHHGTNQSMAPRYIYESLHRRQPPLLHFVRCFNMRHFLAQVTSGNIKELLVAAVYNSPARIDEYTYVADSLYGGGHADNYLDWIESSVLPRLRDKYRLAVALQPLSILGSSLGGLLACYAAWTRPQTYGAAACMSPSFWWDNNNFSGTLMRGPSPATKPTFYLDVGSAETEDMLSSMHLVREQFARLGWPDARLSFYLAPGGTHTEASWGERLSLPLRVLYGVGELEKRAQRAAT